MDKKGKTQGMAYDEFIQLIAQGGGPEAVVAFRPSETVQKHAYDLLDRQRAGTITAEEERELGHFLELEHLVRMAKIRARIILAPPESSRAQAA